MCYLASAMLLPLLHTSMKKAVSVAIRTRPFNSREKKHGSIFGLDMEDEEIFFWDHKRLGEDEGTFGQLPQTEDDRRPEKALHKVGSCSYRTDH